MKKAWQKGLVTLSVLALAACGNSQAPTASTTESSTAITSQDSSVTIASETNTEQTSLVISTFGLSQEEVEKTVMDPFELAEKATITLEVGTGSERLTKLKSNPNAGIDVIELSQTNAGDAAAQGLFETLTEEQIPNIANLSDGAKQVFQQGDGVPYAVNSIGIVYDPETLGRDIKSWEDLWSEDLAGKIAIPDISTTFGPAILYLASEYKGVDIETDKGQAAFEALKELAPNVVKTYAKSSDLANMFQAGEIEVAIVADFAYGIVVGALPNATYVVPESGTIANYNTINVPKTAANKELAYKYINYRISAELAKQTATAFNEGPVNKEVELTAEEAGNKTYGEIASKAKTMNTKLINENMSNWLNEWNEILNQ
ncbi:TPA: ABC transporter substrate-binding protein [Streptococcus suis]